MASAALIIAILSLLVSGFAVYMQWHQWHHARRLKAELRTKTLREYDVDGISFLTYLVVTVVNWSSFPIKVVGVSFMGPSDNLPQTYFAGETRGHPVIGPRDGEDYKVDAVDLKGKVPEGPLVAWVRLATGEELRSDPFHPGVYGLSEPWQRAEP